MTDYAKGFEDGYNCAKADRRVSLEALLWLVVSGTGLAGIVVSFVLMAVR